MGSGLTATDTESVSKSLHPFNATFASWYVVFEVSEGVRTAFPEEFKIIVWFAPPLMVYVTVAPAVPVKLMVADWFEQIAAGALIEAVGTGTTEIVNEPESVWLHPLGKLMSTREYVLSDVTLAMMTEALPAESKVTD